MKAFQAFPENLKISKHFHKNNTLKTMAQHHRGPGDSNRSGPRSCNLCTVSFPAHRHLIHRQNTRRSVPVNTDRIGVRELEHRHSPNTPPPNPALALCGESGRCSLAPSIRALSASQTASGRGPALRAQPRCAHCKMPSSINAPNRPPPSTLTVH